MAKVKPLNRDQDDALLKEIRERFDRAMSFWQEVRDEAKIDMRYVSGDPWDPDEREARDKAGRQCLALDELGQYENQVINDVRANPRAVKFTPTGNGANDDTARFYGDKWREIEYRSHAQLAYTTAFQNMLERSYGWVRVTTKFKPRSFDQELWIEDLPNPDMVLVDPSAKRPDSSDAKFLFVFEQWTQEEFKRTYPKAEIHNFGDYRLEAPNWIQDKTLILAEYWVITLKERELLRIGNPARPDVPAVDVFADELPKMPDQGLVLQRRMESVPVVKSYLTNGVEILKRSEWAGQYLPFASCYGKRIYVDEGAGAKLKILSMTRLARDPYMAYCYARTCEVEAMGGVPRSTWVGYEGQFRGHETEFQKANHEPVPYLEVKATVEGAGVGQVLPLPQKQAWDPPIQNLELAAESFRRAIQAAMGTSFLPTQAQRRNEKSGKALQQIEQTAQKGAYHFVDAYDTMIRHIGVMAEDLMDKIYDTPREVGVRKPDDTATLMRINDPSAAGPDVLPSTKGDHQVTVSAGPSFESEREAASDFADAMAQNPQMFPVIGDLVVKLKNLGPIGDKISDRLKALLPPAVQQLEQAEQADPAMLQRQLAQATEQIGQLSQELTARVQQIETEAVKSQRDVALEQQKQMAETRRTAAKIAADERQAALDNLVKLAIAEINAEASEAKQHAEMARDELGFQHEHAMASGQAGVEQENQAQQRSFEREQGEASRTFESTEAERARQATMQQSMMERPE